MPASFGGVPNGLRPPFGATPQRSSFANANRVSVSDRISGQDSRINLITNPSFEVDTASWIASTSTIARSTADSYIGTASLLHTQTSTASSTSATTSSYLIPVEAGSVYTASAYVKSATGLRSYEIRLYWYNAAGSNSTSTAGGTFATSTTAWTRVHLTTTPPAGAVSFYLTVMTRSTGAIGDSAYIDAVMVERGYGGAYFDGSSGDGYSWTGTAHASTSVGPLSPATRTNLITNPSFEVDTAGWGSTSNCTIARSTADLYSGSASLLLTSTSTSFTTFTNSYQPVSPGKTYTASMYVKQVSGTRGLQIAFQFLSSTGATTQVKGATVTPTTSAWSRASVTTTAPADATQVYVFISHVVTGSIGDATYVDAVLMEQGALDTYFDGYTTGASWGGATSLSASILPTTQAAGSPSTSPSPQVRGQAVTAANDYSSSVVRANYSMPPQAGDLLIAFVEVLDRNYPFDYGSPYVSSVTSGITWTYRLAVDLSYDSSDRYHLYTATATGTSSDDVTFSGAGSGSPCQVYLQVVAVSGAGTAYFSDGTTSIGSAGYLRVNGYLDSAVQTSATTITSQVYPFASIAPSGVVAGRSRTISESSTITDAVSRSAAKMRPVSDALATADAVVGVYVPSSTGVVDSLTLTDSVARVLGRTRTASDTVDVPDVTTRVAALTRALTDSITSSDSLTAAMSRTRSVTDSFSTGDVVARTLVRTRTTADSLTATAAAVRVLDQVRQIVDSVTLTGVAVVLDTYGQMSPSALTGAQMAAAAGTSASMNASQPAAAAMAAATGTAATMTASTTSTSTMTGA